MSEGYDWTEVSYGFTQTEPVTFHRWVWFWQVGLFKHTGWQVEDRTLLKARVWRELRLEDYIYGDNKTAPMGLSKLLTDDPFLGGGIDRGSDAIWHNRSHLD